MFRIIKHNSNAITYWLLDSGVNKGDIDIKAFVILAKRYP